MMLQFSEPINGEYPFEAVILSGLPLYKEKLGDFVIDFSTVVYGKTTLTVDYNHNEDEIIGNAANFHVEERGLVADGKLIEEFDRTKWIVKHSIHGTPFEISPTISEQYADAEKLGDGETATVNGRTVVGPLTIFRNCPIRGFAICPFGTDRNTLFTLLKEEFKMAKNTTKLADDAAASAGETESETKKITNPDLAEFIKIFGKDRGLDLYQSGESIDDARKYKDLIDKFGLPPADDAPAVAELSDEKTKIAPAVPEADQDKTQLNATITALKSEVAKLSEGYMAMRAAVPRGETTPLSGGTEAGQAGQPNVSFAQQVRAKYKR